MVRSRCVYVYVCVECSGGAFVHVVAVAVGRCYSASSAAAGAAARLGVAATFQPPLVKASKQSIYEPVHG